MATRPRGATLRRPTVLRRTAIGVDYSARWGLISYWPLREASGQRNDYTSKGYHLTDNNTVTGAAALFASLGVSSQFVAANTENLSRVDNADLSTGNVDFAVSAFVQFDALGADRVFLYKGSSTSAVGEEFALRYQNSSGRMRWEVGDSTGVGIVSVNATTFGAISAGVPYHVFAYHDSVNNVNGIVVNGVATTTSALGRFPTDTAGAFRIGVLNTASSPHDGRVSDVAFFKSPPGGIAALVAEIPARIYGAGVPRAYPWSL